MACNMIHRLVNQVNYINSQIKSQVSSFEYRIKSQVQIDNPHVSSHEFDDWSLKSLTQVYCSAQH